MKTVGILLKFATGYRFIAVTAMLLSADAQERIWFALICR
jgi:hypothetical protein